MVTMATTMTPAMSSMRVFCPWDMAIKTMTPMDPIMGMTVTRILPTPAGSARSGGVVRGICPVGSSGFPAGSLWAGWAVIASSWSTGTALRQCDPSVSRAG